MHGLRGEIAAVLEGGPRRGFWPGDGVILRRSLLPVRPSANAPPRSSNPNPGVSYVRAQ